jgi:hypothetical protein
MPRASDFGYSPGSNLSAGWLAAHGVYVVAHRDPADVVPHEIMIRTPTILPHRKLCSNVRFSWKCSVPQEIKATDFFFNPDWDSVGLAVHLRDAAAEVHIQAQNSRDLIRQARQFLAHQSVVWST